MDESSRRRKRTATGTVPPPGPPQEDLELSLLAEISALIGHAEDAAKTLPALVTLIAARVGADACSLFHLDQNELVLRATHGLDPASVGHVRMKLSEGLTGLAMEQMKPLAVEEAPTHPRFKYFPETKEELYHSFLGVPLIERRQGMGVLVLQTRRPRRWTRAETLMLTTIASQIVGIVSAATLRESLDGALRRSDAPRPAAGPRMLHGTPAVPGIAHGRAFLFTPRTDLRHLQPMPVDDPEPERARLNQAFTRAIAQVRELHEQLSVRLTPQDAAIFHAHLLFLQDPKFRSKIDAVVGMRQAAEFAVKKVVHDYLAVFEAMSDPYLRERGADIEDIGRRLVENLGEEPHAGALAIPPGAVVVAPTLDPSLSAYLGTQHAGAVATARGGAGGHGVILARSLGIPAVVGIEGLLDQVASGEEIIVDGVAGTVHIGPTRELLQEYERRARLYHEAIDVFERDVAAPAALRDGTPIEITATMGFLGDLDLLPAAGASSIGLYRTEFLFYVLRHLPDEEEQYAHYRRAIEAAKGRPLTIRTLDAGGDKPLPQLRIAKEENPALGLRGLRFLREHPDLLRTQLAALLRAAAHGPIRILVPMVLGLEDWRWARQVRDEVGAELAKKKPGGPAAAAVPFGAMVEVPSAVLLARRLAAEADFLSVGTNDLVQYLLAVDRNNPRIRAGFDPLTPVLLQAVEQVVTAGAEAQTPVSICGELAGHPLGAPLLVGLGARSLCTDASRIPLLKGLLRELDQEALGVLARAAVALPAAAAVRQAALDHLHALRSSRVDHALDALLPGPGADGAGQP